MSRYLNINSFVTNSPSGFMQTFSLFVVIIVSFRRDVGKIVEEANKC